MQTNELRIGNYVSDDEDDSIMIVSSIEDPQYTRWNSGDEFNIVCRASSTTYFEGEFKPIELTEGWILQLGFKKVKLETALKDFYIEYYQKDNFVVYLLSDFFEVELITKSGEQFNLFKTFKKEIHILQNLYFSLMGEELELELYKD